MEIKQTDMPPSEAARRTKEFRCPPKEQMFRLLSFKQVLDNEPTGMTLDSLEDAAAGAIDAVEQQFDQCPTAEALQEQLRDFCSAIVAKLGLNGGEEGKKKDGKGKKKLASTTGGMIDDEEEVSQEM